MRLKIYFVLLLLACTMSAAAQAGRTSAPQAQALRPEVGFDGQVVAPPPRARTEGTAPISSTQEKRLTTEVAPARKKSSRTADKTAFVAGDVLGIFAAAAPAGTALATIPFSSSIFMYNTALTRETSGWSYGNPKLWPTDQNLWVYSYYPHNAAITVTGSNGNTAGPPVIHFTVPADKAAQQDLLYASSPDVAPTAQAIPLPFKHATAQVRIQVTTSTELAPPGYALSVRDVKLTAVRNKGQLNLADGSWSLLDGSTNVELTKLQDREIPAAGAYLDLFENQAGFYMIPQTLSDLKIELTVVAYDPVYGGHLDCQDGVAQTGTVTRTVSSGQWKAGEVYVYKIEVLDSDPISFDDACAPAPPDS